MKEISYWTLVVTLLIGGSVLAFQTPVVKANGTIYIRADGSIEPPTALISTVDNFTYTFAANISADADGIVIERSNIIIDGNGYTLQGLGSGSGFYLNSSTLSIDNVTVKNTNINGFMWGTRFVNSSNNSIEGNNITNCNWRGISFSNTSDNNTICENSIVGPSDTGIQFFAYGGSYRNITIYGNIITSLINIGMGLHFLSDSNVYENIITDCGDALILRYGSNNTVRANELASNGGGSQEAAISILETQGNRFYDNNIAETSEAGIHISQSSDNGFWHNNFINNAPNVRIWYQPVICTWDDGYPSGGNYWSNYAGADFYSGPFQNETGRDGIGDTPYIMNADNQDSYPLMKPYGGINDTGITEIAVSKGVVGQGYNTSVAVTILNYGIYTENLSISVYANATVIASQNITLASRNSTAITFAWDTTGFAAGNYTISAYASPVQGETDTEDNLVIDGFVKIGIPGDVNGDAVVDSTDLGILGGAWGSFRGDLNYVPEADINDDGVVDSSDLGIMGAHWGETE